MKKKSAQPDLEWKIVVNRVNWTSKLNFFFVVFLAPLSEFTYNLMGENFDTLLHPSQSKKKKSPIHSIYRVI